MTFKDLKKTAGIRQNAQYHRKSGPTLAAVGARQNRT